jgi:thiol-disulfide isomerase/thioredoxin
MRNLRIVAMLVFTLSSPFLFFGAGNKEEEEESEAWPSAGGIIEKNLFDALGVSRPVREIVAFDFTSQSLNGKSVKLSDFRGKVVFLNFWATWCGPCRAEVPDIDKLHDTLKNDAFAVLAVDLREDRRIVSSFMARESLDFPVYLDPDGRIAGLYGVNGIPTTYLIDPDGRIAGRAVGPRAWGSGESIELMRSLMKKQRRPE